MRLSLFGIDALNAVLTDEFLAQVAESASNSLVICVCPSWDTTAWPREADSLRESGSFAITVFPADMNALAAGHWSAEEMIEYKLYRLLLLGKSEAESQYSNLAFSEFKRANGTSHSRMLCGLAEAIDRLGDPPGNWVEPTNLQPLVDLLHSEHHCLLVGPSSSGKSFLALFAGLRAGVLARRVLYANVSLVSPEDTARAFRELATLKASSEPAIVIIDDLQSSPGIATYLLGLSRLLNRASGGGSITVLAICWPSFIEEAKPDLADFHVVKVDPTETKRALLVKYGDTLTPHKLNDLFDIAGEDVLLWRLGLETSSSGSLSRSMLAQQLWARRLAGYEGDKTEATRALFVAAILGRYELAVTEGFLGFQADVTKASTSKLVESRALRRSMGKIVLGHRSLCTLLSELLLSDSKAVADLRSHGRPTAPTDIVAAYLRAAGASEMWAILKKLQMQVGFKRISDLSDRTQILVDVWQAIDVLLERLLQQQQSDPTWGRNLASALFAIEALCAVGQRQQARASIEFMRENWALQDGNMRILPGSTERLDFDEIKRCMMREDDAYGAERARALRGAEIDAGRMHAAWARGLVLCSEAAFADRSPEAILDLARAVEADQEANGSFYPDRVPWITARVLMGLARCGRTCANSDVVKRACDWLLTSADLDGPYQRGLWESGTGSWNTTLETTCMCVIALVLAGVPSNDDRIAAAWSYIMSARPEWIRPGREIDGANAILACLTVLGTWQDVLPQVQYLLRWARSEALWSRATLSSKESLDQSSKAAVIADYLIDAAWSNLRRDLPRLLQAFAVAPAMAQAAPIGLVDDDAHMARIKQARDQVLAQMLTGHGARRESLLRQIQELDVYSEAVADSRMGSEGTETLRRRRLALDQRIRELDSSYEESLERVKRAETVEELRDIHGKWQDALTDA